MNLSQSMFQIFASSADLLDWTGFSASVDKFFIEPFFSLPARIPLLNTVILFLFFGGFAAAITGRLKRAKTHAQKAENRLQTTLDSIGEAVIATDTQGLVRRMNPRGEKLTGWKLTEIRNRHIADVLQLLDPHTRQRCTDPVQKVLAESTIQHRTSHTLLLSRNNREYHIASSASPILDDNGETTGVVLVLRDVSEEHTSQLLTRKRLEIADFDASNSTDSMVTWALDEITGLLKSPVGFFQILTETEEEPVQHHWSSSTLQIYSGLRDGNARMPAFLSALRDECLRTGKSAARNHKQYLPRTRKASDDHVHISRAMIVPVLREDRVVALLGAGNKPGEYTERDQEIGAFLADVTWGVSQRRRAEEKAFHLNRVLSALRRVNQLITTEKNRDRLIKKACDKLTETRGYHCAWILLFDDRGGIAAAAEAGLFREFPLFLQRLREGERFYCVRKAWKQQEILVVHEPSSFCADCPLTEKHASRATMSVRLEHKGRMHGMLAVSMDRSFARYTEEWDLFREVAADLAFALYNLDLEEEHRHSVEALRESERQLSALMANLPGMAYRCRNDADWTMEFVSQGCRELTGYDSTDLVDNKKAAYLDLISPSDRERARRVVQEAVRTGSHFEVEYRITTANGEEKHVWHRGVCVTSKGRGPFLKGFISDITEKKRAETALHRQKDHMRAILQANPDPLVVYDRRGHPQYINPAFTRVFGWSIDELRGRRIPFVPEDQSERTNAALQEIFDTGEPVQFDTKRLTRDGRILDIRVSAALISRKQEDHSGLVVNLTDITERKRLEKELEEMSLYDTLTGLYNRAFFEEEMRRMESKRCSCAAVVVCDIDGLKLINDTLGHNKGDELLRAAADVLRACFRAGDIAARIGGDEFAVLLSDTDEETVRARCEQVHAEVADYHLRNPELGLSVSVGHAVTRERPEDMKALFKRADDAMYKQKLQQSRNSRNETIQALITTMEARDNVTDGHAARLANYARKLGRSLGLSGNRLKDLRLLARFHDLGKVGVPDSILFKPAPLTEEEFAEMKRHCEIGQRIALSTADLAPIADFILKHHEWWNGEGYPLGLQGEEIPLESRILAVVDAYDTITSKRPYKEALSHEQAINELLHCSGTQFDPELVEEFVQIVEAPASR